MQERKRKEGSICIFTASRQSPMGWVLPVSVDRKESREGQQGHVALRLLSWLNRKKHLCVKAVNLVNFAVVSGQLEVLLSLKRLVNQGLLVFGGVPHPYVN